MIFATHAWWGSSQSDFVAETAAALAAALAVVLLGRRLSLSPRTGEKGERALLPSNAYLLHEAGPYLAFSVLYMTLFVAPHVLSWAGMLPPRMSRTVAIGTMEHWLTLGFPPLLIATGLAEQASTAFWRRAAAAQRATAGIRPGDFGQMVLRNLYLPQLGRLAVVLGLACLATWSTIESGAAGSLSVWLRPPEGFEAELVFVSALAGYSLLGWGLLNLTYTLSLARPELALKDVLPALGIALMVGIPLSFGVGFEYSVVGFVTGGLTLVLTSSRTTWNLLRSADYHYFASI
jgi:hypothetical protein